MFSAVKSADASITSIAKAKCFLPQTTHVKKMHANNPIKIPSARAPVASSDNFFAVAEV